MTYERKIATAKQISYIEQLFIDIGFGADEMGRVARNALLSDQMKRQIKFLDQLSSVEASQIIDVLKSRKGEINGKPR